MPDELFAAKTLNTCNGCRTNLVYSVSSSHAATVKVISDGIVAVPEGTG